MEPIWRRKKGQSIRADSAAASIVNAYSTVNMPVRDASFPSPALTRLTNNAATLPDSTSLYRCYIAMVIIAVDKKHIGPVSETVPAMNLIDRDE